MTCEVESRGAIVGAHDLYRARRAARRRAATSAPARNAASVSIGLSVAERPMRVGRGAPRLPHHPFEPLQREREMSAALVAGDRVELVDDHVADGGELLAKARRGQQDEERLGRGDENMRRPPEHRGAFVRGRIAGAKAGADAARSGPFGGDFAHAVERLFEIEADVVGQRLERRDVEDRDFVAQSTGFGLER